MQHSFFTNFTQTDTWRQIQLNTCISFVINYTFWTKRHNCEAVRSIFSSLLQIRKQIRNFLNPLSRVEIFESDNISDTCGRSNPDIFWYDVVTKLAPVFTSQI